MSKNLKNDSAARTAAREAWTTAFVQQCRAANARRVMIASAGNDGDGVMLAVELAETLAAAGAKVLVVDCDLRRGALQKQLQRSVPEEKCLAAVLTAAQGTRPGAVSTRGFHAVLAGETDQMPSALLDSPRMKELLNDLTQHYDYVLCVAPPVSAAPDAGVLGRRCDGAVLAVRYRGTDRRTVTDAATVLQHSGTKLLGTVLTEYDLTMARKMGEPYIHYGRS
ncbi:MAG: CpsD/CapB family tyrosine-protein kinase [Clostridia bacterium]|nr:CpsD/CapB family tyrosine-protein kinase [Clostridia bacterium]